MITFSSICLNLAYQYRGLLYQHDIIYSFDCLSVYSVFFNKMFITYCLDKLCIFILLFSVENPLKNHGKKSSYQFAFWGLLSVYIAFLFFKAELIFFFWKLSLGYSDVFRGFQWVFNNFCELWWCLCLLFLFVTVFILLRCWSLLLEALFAVISNCFLLFRAYITLVYLCRFHGFYFVT